MNNNNSASRPSFIKRIFPNKEDTVKEKLRKIALIIATIVFLTSSVVLIYTLVIMPNQQKNVMNEITEVYYENPESVELPPTETRQERLNRAKSMSEDIVGWINISNTNINYPVLIPPANDPLFYLYRNYKKESTRYGSIFLDETTDLYNNYKNIVIYGHHMLDGTMFNNLLKLEDLDFYKENPVINFDTTKEVADWKVISIFKANTLEDQGEIFHYVKTGFSGKEDFLNYVYQVRERSLIDMPVDIAFDDELITLSTCSYEFKDFRTVVVARKVRKSETLDVDVSKAKLNPDPLMPECWYQKYGGSAPQITDFATAYSDKKIDWYIKK